jgi:hypothetical protein
MLPISSLPVPMSWLIEDNISRDYDMLIDSINKCVVS